jgi:nitrite reductase/ring-hydroxylating ferredoxin subunit
MSGTHVAYIVGTVDSITPGGCRIVQVGRVSIGVFNLDGSFYALLNRCPHQGGPLCLGSTERLLTHSSPSNYCYDPTEYIVRCPWHGWEFSISSGRSIASPTEYAVQTFHVDIQLGDALATQSTVDAYPLTDTASAQPPQAGISYVVLWVSTAWLRHDHRARSGA